MGSIGAGGAVQGFNRFFEAFLDRVINGSWTAMNREPPEPRRTP
jgi:hypothetical protein